MLTEQSEKEHRLIVDRHNAIIMAIQFPTDCIAFFPGVYKILDQDHVDGPIDIGSFILLEADLPELTEDRIAAIRSDPKSPKGYTLVCGCKNCNERIEIYAALERADSKFPNAIWYSDAPQHFQCSCEQLSVDLSSVRRKLRAFLGAPDLNKYSREEFVPLYERSAVNSLLQNFENILAEDVSEERMHRFIFENPLTLRQFSAHNIKNKPPILNKYKADFGIVTTNRDLLLVEIEKPALRLLTRSGERTAELNHAFAQVHSWLAEFEDHRVAILNDLGIEYKHINAIRGIVVAGRDLKYDRHALRILKSTDHGKVSFFTYDDILESVCSLVRDFAKL